MIIEILQTYPKLTISLFAAMITFVMTIIYKFTTDQERLGQIKREQKKYQEEAKNHKSNPQKMMEINKKVLQLSGEMMKHSLKPMAITMLPMFVLIIWLRNIYSPILSSWIWYYIIVGIITNGIFRKLLKVQ